MTEDHFSSQLDADGPNSRKGAVSSLLHGWSTEVLPRERDRIAGYRDVLPAGTEVYIAFLPGTGAPEIVDTAVALREAGFEPVPHVTARGTPDRCAFDNYVAALVGEAGVERMLVIGGDRDRPAGDYDAVMQLLETGVLEARGIRAIGVAGHPEGNPAIGDAALAAALAAKNAWAAQSSIAVRIVTQFCFAPEPIIAWERAAREAGNRLPVQVGLPGVTSVRSLIAYGRACGVGSSLRGLSRHGSSLTRLAATWSPGALVSSLAAHRAADPETLIEGVHMFSFGALEKTARWADAVAGGRFEMSRKDDSLKLNKSR
jgi:methylenetetrahydrofolate reductase (NADPH)